VRTEIADVLDQQIRCAEDMLRALGRENEALVAGNSDLISAAGAEKASIVDSLEALEAARRRLGDDGDARGSTQWQALLGLVSACKEQNQRNGALLKARTEQLEIALQALRGSEPGFYDPSGLKASPRSARALGTA
jgi:flagellar biosynthesis/type III secretory pathway chaperone